MINPECLMLCSCHVMPCSCHQFKKVMPVDYRELFVHYFLRLNIRSILLMSVNLMLLLPAGSNCRWRMHLSIDVLPSQQPPSISPRAGADSPVSAADAPRSLWQVPLLQDTLLLAVASTIYTYEVLIPASLCNSSFVSQRTTSSRGRRVSLFGPVVVPSRPSISALGASYEKGPCTPGGP